MSKCQDLMMKLKQGQGMGPRPLEFTNIEVHNWRKGKREYSQALLDFKTHLLVGEGETCEVMPLNKIDLIVVSNIHKIEIKDIEPPSDIEEEANIE
jgi:hypothetical protein